MQSLFVSIRRRFVLGVVFALVSSFLASYSALAWLQLYPLHPFFRSVPDIVWLLATLGLAAVAATYFWTMLETLSVQSNRTEQTQMPPEIHQKIARLLPHFWVFLLAHALISALMNFWGIAQWTVVHSEQDAFILFGNIVLVQLTVTLLVGVPVYLLLLMALGRLFASLGLDKVQASIQTRLLMTCFLVPLLAGVVMAYTAWWSSGELAPDVVVVWILFLLYLALTMLLLVRSLLQSLRPVYEALQQDSGQARYLALTRLRPLSNDELGYFTQIVGQLSRWLYKQDLRLRTVIAGAPEAIIVTNDAGFITDINTAALRLFEYKDTDIRGRALAKLLPAMLSETGQPRSFAEEQLLEGLRSNGEKFSVAVRVSSAQMGNNKWHVCYIAEASRQETAPEAGPQAAASYRDMIESAGDVIWTLDAAGRWTFLNSSARSIYGIRPMEMIGRNYLDFVAPECVEREKAALSELRSGKEKMEYDTVHLREDGSRRELSCIVKAAKDDEGNLSYMIGSARDITERKAHEQQLAYQVAHDPLTGLFNRQYFQQELDRLVARVVRGGKGGAIMFVDLDQLKMVNDTLGHAQGDRLLVEASKLMKTHIREGDLLARYGGDEFTILLYNVDIENATRVAENLRARFNDYRFICEGNQYEVTCSIGIAMIADGVLSASDCLSLAERACNLAKTKGRNQVQLYEPEKVEIKQANQTAGWAEQIRDLLERGRISLVYQPIVALGTGAIYDYEVCVRIVDDEGKPISPGGFLPTIERLGLSAQLDRLVVVKALERLAAMRKAGTPVRFSVNLSAHAFEDPEIVPMIADQLKAHDLDSSVLTVEITETAVVTNLAAAAAFIETLKDIGVQVALDHFGAGFSSFTHLKQLAVDKIKINNTYVQGLPNSLVNQAVIRSMNQVAHALGKTTVGGHVENREVLSTLRDLGVDFAQGHYIASPADSVGKDRFTGIPLQ